ncbi:hypothetical protein K490DRAFT_31401, partial [Saccharata proteae CBS 121410]
PTRPSTPPSYLSALRQLESPVSPQVINLAATLTTQAENEADEDNISFLRRPVDPQEEWRQQNADAEHGLVLLDEARNVQERLRARAAELHTLTDRQLRLSRLLARLSRADDPAHTDHQPSTNSRYDWALLNETDDVDELQEILQELRRRHPDTHQNLWSRVESEREQRNRSYSSRYNPNTNTQPSESSLRSTQWRRYPRFSARSRDNMQRYIMDRDAAQRAVREGDTSRGSPPANLSLIDAADRYVHSTRADRNSSDRAQERDIRARIDSYRRSYLDNPASSSSPASTSPWLEQTIKYLSLVRSSESYENSLYHAVDSGFVTKEFFGDSHDDFILDIDSLPPPSETSFLKPGAVFSGSQHATTVTADGPSSSTPAGSSTTLYRFRNNEPPMTSTTFDAARPWLSHNNSVPPHARRAPDTATQPTQQDRWPVKVTVHAVDYETMTLSATMEAYNVPSHPPTLNSIITTANSTSVSTSTNTPSTNSNVNPLPTVRTSSITTYLEGEILDMQNHTLLTESFKSTPANDATYWRKLPPFAHMGDSELIHNLVSREFMTRLSQDWILMRWKERCFVKPTRTARTASPSERPATTRPEWQEGLSAQERPRVDEEMAADGCGLTISGFYYVCLRRSDGAVEGLYYDPQSSPYQHLKLAPVAAGNFPSWKFR